MSERSIAPTQQAAIPPASQAPSGLLQRQCACGKHTMGGVCEECRGERSLSRPISAAGASVGGLPKLARVQSPILQRQPTVGWTGAGSLNATASQDPATKVRRIPLSGLQQGQQTGSGQGQSGTGRAIVVLPDNFDPTQPTRVLIFFHGWSPPEGYLVSGGSYLDRDTHKIESQVAASGQQQLIGLLPQGSGKSSFGETSGKKSFNSDAFVTEILAALKTTQGWTGVPTVTGVMISGHSGAGELINEQLLASAAPPPGVSQVTTSSLPSKVGRLTEVALFDAINGPKELAAVKSWLEKTMDDDLAALSRLSSIQDKRNYLKTSTRFRAYYSHTNNDSYVPRHRETQKAIDDWLTAHDAQLGGAGSPVYTDLSENYKTFDVGHSDHAAILSRGSKLQDALSMMPKRAPNAKPEPWIAPSQVHDALKSSGDPLDTRTRSWAENALGRDFSHVRVHTGEKAAESARATQSLAFTVGHDIVFGESQYIPRTEVGRKLLMHELTHVVQQRGVSRPYPATLNIGPANDAFEAEAEHRSRRLSSDAGCASAGPTLQRAPDSSPLKRSVCETTKDPPDAKPGDCIYKFPESCPTYENWITTFASLKTFEARATPDPQVIKGHVAGPNVFPVIGEEAATRGAKENTEKAAPPTTPLRSGEKFIDHPTDEWVKTCLPANLRATAYKLPADCADIAIILRHVWLAAHNRTETFGKWTIGDIAGGPASDRVGEVIKEVSTINVAQMVNPYIDANGAPVVSFEALQPLLHAGDILVWEHHDNGFDKKRTGGHTLTITRVERDPGGRILSVSALQGNEPIFEAGPGWGPEADDKGKIIKALKLKDTKAAREELGSEPGRRIETNILKGGDLQDSDPENDKTSRKTWKWGKSTILVAAGPPKAASRPSMKKEGGKEVRRLSDWFPKLKTSSRSELPGVFEAVLGEARAMIEAGEAVADNDMRLIGEVTGERVWELAKQDKDLGGQSHLKIQSQLRSTVRAFVASPTGGNPYLIQLSFAQIEEAFTLAARGGADIKFASASSVRGELVKVLVTGFDPFDPSGNLAPPQPGAWNPSGAAVMALDNHAIPVPLTKGKQAVAAVEGVVLPVDFNDFRSGLVERILKPVAQDVDAVITASVDPNLSPGAPVRLERYAVGVHSFGGGEPIPAADKRSIGPAIIESPAPLEQIRDETKQPASRKAAGIAEPDIGEDIKFQFTSATDAANAASALIKQSSDPVLAKSRIQQTQTLLTISDHEAIQNMSRTMTRDAEGRGVGFEVAGRKFHASLMQGPGGDFLSNEISYRTLRLLGETKSPKSPLSFHIHTEQGDVVPQEAGTKAARKERATAVSKAAGVLDRLLTTLRKMIAVVTRLIAGKRTGKVPGTP
jgi:hypothetical protein